MTEDNNRREDGKRPHRPRKAGGPVYITKKDSREVSEDFGERPRSTRPHTDRPNGDRPYKKSYDKGRPSSGRPRSERPAGRSYGRPADDSQSGERKPFKKNNDSKKNYSPKADKRRKPQQVRKPKEVKPVPPTAMPNPANEGTTRLNKYIANAGICSRREADKLIAAGAVSVNGVVVTEMGFKVKPGDVVNYGGERLSSEAKRYFLLNKPKGFITTLDDPQERRTVMELIEGACNERIYPVGRLDRDTTGLLLFTNDGELAKKLTHPSTGVYKIYQVELNRPVTREDMRAMLEGVELEDGPIALDDVQYVSNANDKRVVGVELHSGRNRIVRRVFEHFGYEVHKLDRTVFAGLTKKDLPRGRYRELTAKEVAFLKMI